ncbi:MAG: DNA-binding transcriptional regulator [Chloroflexia bacterium]|nr:DNA-binding transcriptional regulator [Chloroflexia bacterium]
MNGDDEPRESILKVVHETASDLFEVGIIDKQTMREFDELCLTPVRDLTSHEIRNLRERAHVSQSVFAQHLNVNKSLVSQWERGEKRPSGPSLKLLALVEKNGLSAIL